MNQPYQLTPRASKGNAFCWMSWEPQINWRSSGANSGSFGAQAKRSQAIEEKRAAGIDPLHMRGLGRKVDSDPMRFAVMDWKKRA